MPNTESAHASTVQDIQALEQAMFDFVEANALPVDIYARAEVPPTLFLTDTPRLATTDILAKLTSYTEALRVNGMRKVLENGRMAYRTYESEDQRTRAYLLFDRFGRVIMCARHINDEPFTWYGLRVYDVTPMQCGAVLESAKLLSARLAG